jgi:hypothetical protein
LAKEEKRVEKESIFSNSQAQTNYGGKKKRFL